MNDLRERIISTLRESLDNGQTTMEKTIEYALLNDSTYILDELVKYRTIRLIEEYYKYAVMSGCITVMNWLWSKLKCRRTMYYILNYSKDSNTKERLIRWLSIITENKHPREFRPVFYRDDIQIFKLMLELGWYYNHQSVYEILRYGCYNIFKYIQKLKIKYCAPFDVYDKNNLYHVCASGDFKFYMYYNRLNLNCNHTDLDYSLPAYLGYLTFFTQLEQYRKKYPDFPAPNWTVPFFAAANGKLDLLKFCINRGYHNNALFSANFVPDISEVFLRIFGTRNSGLSLFIKYLYSTNYSVMNKIIDIAELGNHTTCTYYLLSLN